MVDFDLRISDTYVNRKHGNKRHANNVRHRREAKITALRKRPRKRPVMGGKKNAWESDKAPKIGVSWFDANNFACKLGQKTGRQYRLLTDAEWEFAARGGKDGVADKFKFSGSNNVDDVAWYSENSGGKSHDVATKKPNKLGLYDMSGNSWEWVYDWLVGYVRKNT